MKLRNRLLSGIAVTATLIGSAVAGEGTVVSAIPTDMYTYVEVSQPDKTIWIAGPKVALKAGDRIQFADGMTMANFQSKQLQRTFPAIMFVQEIAVAGAAK